MVTRAELAAQRAAGTSQEGRLAALKTQRTVGLSVDDLESVRLQRVEAKAMEAFGASTLLEAQEAIGAAIPSIVTSMTLDIDFDSPSGAAPQTTATRTLNVPAGNPGFLSVSITQDTPTIVRYSLAGGADTAIADGQILDVADTNTLDFTMATGVSVTTISLYDGTTSALIGSPFTITTT